MKPITRTTKEGAVNAKINNKPPERYQKTLDQALAKKAVTFEAENDEERMKKIENEL